MQRLVSRGRFIQFCEICRQPIEIGQIAFHHSSQNGRAYTSNFACAGHDTKLLQRFNQRRLIRLKSLIKSRTLIRLSEREIRDMAFNILLGKDQDSHG